MERLRGSYIAGEFSAPTEGDEFTSRDPAQDGVPVARGRSWVTAVDIAVAAARAAASGWRRLGLEGRIAALRAVRDKVAEHAVPMAEAITAEMGKPYAESLGEAQSVAAKIDGVIAGLAHELPPAAPGAPGEQRFAPLGVMAVVGPFNFPVHLCNTHVIPALITGNAVVVKPSEVTPLAGQRYAELFEAAGFPAGVFNLVQGQGDVGAALVAHPEIDGVVFTGSYRTGRHIRRALFDQPHKKLSLELGGRNPVVVLDDADLAQAEREILLGALLTSGQRCTATSRIIATPKIADALLGRLHQALSQIEPGDPKDPATLMGPLATEAARERFLALLCEAQAQGARPLLDSVPRPGGAFVTPSLYEVTGDEPFLQEELFGPHLDFERAADEADAFRRAARNPYGLSASLFSARPQTLEPFCDEVRAGVINFNRSTNGASGLLPFGGTGMSGNWQAAGSAAPRLCTYPVAIMQVPHGHLTPHPALEAQLGGGSR